jgi:FAD/FMN-containing dehydrogenase
MIENRDVTALLKDLARAPSLQVAAGEQAADAAGVALWNGAIAPRPAVLVQCRDVAGVRRVVSICHDHGTPMSVLGGGHDWAGRAVLAGGVVIDLRSLSSVCVDTKTTTVTVGGGALTDDIMRSLPDELAAVTGNWSSVGVAGLALGGGYGKLNRRFGLVADTLLSAEVVLADGSVVIASEREDADLFWALRGGGGNFGVVTSMTMALFPLQQVLHGVFFVPLDKARAAMLAVQEMLEEEGDDLSIFSALATVPHAGRGLVLAPMWTGARAAGETKMERVASLEGAHRVVQRWSTYRDSYDKSVEASAPKGVGYRIDAHNLSRFDEATVDILLAAARGFTSDRDSLIMHDFHGAAARVPADRTAFALREDHINVQVVSSWSPDDGRSGAEASAWVARLRAALSPLAPRGGYPNLLGPGERESARAFYREALPRLARAKRHYDPDDRFPSAIGIVRTA